MKKIFTKNSLIVATLMLSVAAFGAKISDNTLKLGDSNVATDKTMQMGDGVLKWDGTESKLRFSNDTGSNFQDFGGAPSVAGSFQLLDNPGAELGTSSWAASAGTFQAINSPTTDVAIDSQSFSWDSSATSDTIVSNLQVIPPGLYGKSCLARIGSYKGLSFASDFSFQVLDQTAAIIATTDLTTTTNFISNDLVFTCPTSGSLRIRILANNGVKNIIFDDVYLGSNFLTAPVTTGVVNTPFSAGIKIYGGRIDTAACALSKDTGLGSAWGTLTHSPPSTCAFSWQVGFDRTKTICTCSGVGGTNEICNLVSIDDASASVQTRDSGGSAIVSEVHVQCWEHN